jgi:2-aminoethylphosphonate-pyruvate transaminase
MKKYKKILLNPGPANTTKAVKNAQVVEDICPRVDEFGELLQNTRTDLTKLVANNKEYSTILFGASGTASVEAVISSIFHKDHRLVIVNNGSYGKRILDIANTYAVTNFEFESDFFNEIDIIELEKFVKKNKATHIAIVHNETSTGLLNDLDKIQEIVKKNDLITIVDAMSSFAAVPIDMHDQNIDFLCCSSNKNLQGMAGISFVIAKKKTIESIKEYKSNSYYLDLYSQYTYLEENNQTRFTPPVQTIYALQKAIDELKIETIQSRYDRYKRLWKIINHQMSSLNFKTFLKEENQSKIITLYTLPKNIEFEELHDYLYKYGVTIYPSKFNDQSFRIANIGDLTEGDIDFFVKKIKQFINENK